MAKEQAETPSVLDLLLRPDLPDTRKDLPKKKVEIPRLSNLTGTPVVFTVRALSYSEVRRVWDKPKGEQSVEGVVLGCVEPNWRASELLAPDRSIATPTDAIKARLTAGEIDDLYLEIQGLSGYLGKTLKDLGNA